MQGKTNSNSPLGWSWEGTYRQLPAEINPREIENFISASDENSGVTLSTNLAVADWIDPGENLSIILCSRE